MDINQQEDFQNEIEAQELKVATRIQEERLARKLSQLDLALEAGISQGYLAMVESHQKIPTITTIFKIARALNISPTELFEKQDIDRQAIKNQVISLIQSKLEFCHHIFT